MNLQKCQENKIKKDKKYRNVKKKYFSIFIMIVIQQIHCSQSGKGM